MFPFYCYYFLFTFVAKFTLKCMNSLSTFQYVTLLYQSRLRFYYDFSEICKVS